MVFLTKLKPEPMGAHSLSTAYEVNSLVMSGDGAAAYISVQDVPAGTPLSNTEYWKVHTDLTAVAQNASAARDDMLQIARGLTETVEKSGNPVQAELVGGMPFDRVATVLTPIQSGSGDPSPNNIRTISGWTGAELARCGKNLINPELADGAVTKNGITFTNNGNGTYTVNGTCTSDVQFVLGKNLPRMANIKFTCSPPGITSAQGWTGIVVDNDFSHIIWSGSTGSISSDNNVAILYCNKGNTFDNVLYKPMLTDDLTATYDDFVPYHGNTYAAEFGQTVYGGTLDWQTGVMTVEWGLISSYSGEALPGKWISDRDVYSAGATPTSGAQIAYKLATPTTIQLTPQEIKQLQGVNTLYGDGSISMMGRADKTLALDKRIAALEAAGNAG